MPVVKGNFNKIAIESGQWVMGLAKLNPKGEKILHNNNFALKWSKILKGEIKSVMTANKASKTISILIYGKLKVDLRGNQKSVILEKEGDYIYLPPKTKHVWKALKDCLVITLRWPPLDDQY